MNGRLKKVISVTVILGLCFTLFAAFATTETYAASKTHLKKTTITMLRGETYQQKLLTSGNKTISTSKVKWSSSNSKVAKISKTGKVTAVKIGKTTLKAMYKGKTYRFKVDVKKGVLSGPLDPIMVGKACNVVDLQRKDRDDGFATQVVPNSKVKYWSSNSDVVALEKKGKDMFVRGVSEGNAIVYGTYCGVTYKTRVEVQKHTLNNFELQTREGFIYCCYDSNDVFNVSFKVLEGKELLNNRQCFFASDNEGDLSYRLALNPSATGQIKVKVYSKYDSTLSYTYVVNVRNGKLVGEEGEETTSKPPTYANVGIPDFGVLAGLPTIFEGEVENSMTYVYDCNEVDIVARALCASYRDYLIDYYGWKFYKTESTDDGGIAYVLYNSNHTLGIFCNPKEGGQRITVMILNR